MSDSIGDAQIDANALARRISELCREFEQTYPDTGINVSYGSELLAIPNVNGTTYRPKVSSASVQLFIWTDAQKAY